MHANLRELPPHPVQQRRRAARPAHRIKMQHERLACFRIPAIRVARLGKQASRLVKRLSHRPAIADVVDHRVDASGRSLIAKHPGRHGPIGHLRLAVLEDRHELLPVEGDTQRMAQLAVALLLLGRVAQTHHRIAPVEPEVLILRLDRGGQLDGMFRVKRRLFARVARRHQHRHARIAALDLGNVVIPLHELTLQRDRLLFNVEHNAVDKRCHLAAIG